MPTPDRLGPLIAADVALRLGLAKPWDVMAALQAAGPTGASDLDAFLGDLSRIARLGPDELARLKAEATARLSAERRDPAAALSRLGGPVASAAGPQAEAAATPPAGHALRRVPEGRYRDFAPVGEGGMGIVYWALDTELNRQVAFKIVRPDLAVTGGPHTPVTPLEAAPPRGESPASRAFHELRARFLQEAWVTGGLEHPGVVPVYEMGQTAHGIPYYTMRFVRGNRTLASALEEAAAGGHAARLQLLEPFLKVCDTIGYAHSKGVVHRDLKPQNIALGEFGEVVVLDWGLAKSKGSADPAASRWQERIADFRAQASLRTALGPLGTPGYMSPEAALGRIDEIGEASDVYSLGAILFEILTGRLPFRFSTYGEYVEQVAGQRAPAAVDVDAGVPQVLSDLCARALSQSPSLRPARTAELAATIRQWQAATALASEIEQALKEARATLRAAGFASGDERIQALDRVAGACEQVLRRQADQAEARTLLDQAREQRAGALAERDRAARRRLVRLAGVSALAAAALVAVGTAFAIHAQKGEAERATRAAQTASEEREQQRLRANEQALEAQAARTEAEGLARKAQEAEARAATQAQEAREARSLAEAKAGEALAEAQRAREASEALERSYQRARALALAAAAQRELQSSPTVGLHLALAALAAEELPETIEAGLAALNSPVELDPVVVDGPGVLDARFLGDGQRLLTLSTSGTVELWSAEGRRSGHFPGSLATTVTVQQQERPESKDEAGRTVPAELRTITLPLPVELHRIASDTAVVTIEAGGQAARLWTLTGGAVTLGGHEAKVTAIVLDPASGEVLTGDAAGRVRHWSAKGRLVRTHPPGPAPIVSLALAPGGAWGAALDLRGVVRSVPRSGTSRELAKDVPVASGEALHEDRERQPVAAVQPLDGQRMLVETDDALIAYDREGQQSWRFPPSPAVPGQEAQAPRMMVIAPDGRVTLSQANGEIVTLNGSGEVLGRFRVGAGTEHAHNCLATQDGGFVTASMCGAQDFHAYDTESGRQTLLVPTTVGVEFHHARPSLDLSRVVVWHRTGPAVQRFARSPLEHGVRSEVHLTFDGRGDLLVHDLRTGTLRRWKTAEGGWSAVLASVAGREPLPPGPLPPERGPGSVALLERDGRIVWSARRTPDLVELRCLDGDRLTLSRDLGGVICAPSCDRLLSRPVGARAAGAAVPAAGAAPACGAGGKACGGDAEEAGASPSVLIDAEGRELARLPGVLEAAFDDRGHHLLCTHTDGTAALYGRDGARLRVFRDASKASLSPTGAHVAYESSDGSIQLWDRRSDRTRVVRPPRPPVPEGSTPPSRDSRAANHRPTFVCGGRALVCFDHAGHGLLCDLEGTTLHTLSQPHEVLELEAPRAADYVVGSVQVYGEMAARGHLQIWRLDGSTLRLATYDAGGAPRVQATDSGSVIALPGHRRSFVLRDPDGRTLRTVPGIETSHAWRLAPDGRALVVGPARPGEAASSQFTAWAYLPLEREPLLRALRARGARALGPDERARYADLLDAPR